MIWLVTILSLFTGPAFAEGEAAGTPPTFKMDGSAALMTNYMEYGITQTTKDPSLQGTFWFNWGPQFRLGLWGSNTNFENSDTHLHLKVAAEIKVPFSEHAGMTLAYFDHRFYKPETREGNTVELRLTFFDWTIFYEQISNFEGTQTKGSSYGFEKELPVFGNWKWKNTVGYVSVTEPGLNNFFWWETALGIKPGGIFYEVGGTYNSSASQFSGSADPMIFLRATVNF